MASRPFTRTRAPSLFPKMARSVCFRRIEFPIFGLKSKQAHSHICLSWPACSGRESAPVCRPLSSMGSHLDPKALFGTFQREPPGGGTLMDSSLLAILRKGSSSYGRRSSVSPISQGPHWNSSFLPNALSSGGPRGPWRNVFPLTLLAAGNLARQLQHLQAQRFHTAWAGLSWLPPLRASQAPAPH